MNCLTLMYTIQQHCGNLHWVQGLQQRCKESNDILKWITIAKRCSFGMFVDMKEDKVSIPWLHAMSLC
jgi:hypothetical protein